jgi:DNA mismatch repair ATPase MutL
MSDTQENIEDVVVIEIIKEFNDESKEEMNDESKEEMNEESKEEMNEESKEEMNEESKEEMNEESKEEEVDESKEEMNDESKEEMNEESKEEEVDESKEEMNEESEEESKEEVADDNKLISKYIKTKWDEEDILKDLEYKMNMLKMVTYNKNIITDEIMEQARDDIFKPLGWTTAYATFSKTVVHILNRTKPRIPFSKLTKDEYTGYINFWLVKTFVLVKDPTNMTDLYYVDKEGRKAPKHVVLMSNQFKVYLAKYIKDYYNDEVHFWPFSGLINTGKHHFSIDKVDEYERKLLPDQNPKTMVMFQFKKKSQSQMVGGGIIKE